MTRAQFLNELYRRLPGLTQEQAEQHLTYYAEMLADRMEEGMSEEEAVASMEPVDVIAQRILQDEGVPEGQPPPLAGPAGDRRLPVYQNAGFPEVTKWEKTDTDSAVGGGYCRSCLRCGAVAGAEYLLHYRRILRRAAHRGRGRLADSQG